MFRITPGTNKIYLTKGDTATMKVTIHDSDGLPYKIKQDDIITFTCKKNIYSEQEAFSCVAENEVIIIYGNQTEELATGLYLYQVDLEDVDGNQFTIIEPTPLTLLGDLK